MTVLEAIKLKGLIDLKESRLMMLKKQLRDARIKYDSAENDNKNRIEKSVSDQTQAGNKDVELEKSLKESIERLYPVAMIDPLKIEEKIKEDEKFIEDFKSEVDFVLSESNSITYIELCD
jgi:hypothetical protein